MLTLLVIPIFGFGQDKFDEISFVDGNTINAEVIEIGPNEISFRYEKETLINRVDISKIVSINFSSGRKQLFKPQIKHTDFKRMIEGMELYKGVNSEIKEWLINKGFSLKSGRHEKKWIGSSGTAYDDGKALSYDNFLHDYFKILFDIYDEDGFVGRKKIEIEFTKDSDHLYETIRSELSKKHTVKSFKHGNWYAWPAEEIKMYNDSYVVVFIRGITETHAGFKCGHIFICNYSHLDSY